MALTSVREVCWLVADGCDGSAAFVIQPDSFVVDTASGREGTSHKVGNFGVLDGASGDTYRFGAIGDDEAFV